MVNIAITMSKIIKRQQKKKIIKSLKFVNNFDNTIYKVPIGILDQFHKFDSKEKIIKTISLR